MDRPVPGLGDQATAIFTTIAPGPLRGTELYVRSGDALIAVGLGTSKPADAAALSRAIAIARDVLANLAKAPPPGQQPRYAGDFDPCHILRATVPRYLPSAIEDPDQPSTTRQFEDTCSWSTPGSARTLLARADIYGFVTGPQGAEQAFSSDVRSNPGSGLTGQQPVTGLGDQAVAAFRVQRHFAHGAASRLVEQCRGPGQLLNQPGPVDADARGTAGRRDRDRS